MSEGFYNKIREVGNAQGSQDQKDYGGLLYEYIDKIQNNEKDKGGAAVVADHIFQEMCDTDNPQGVLAIVKFLHDMGEDGVKAAVRDGAFVVVLDTLQDPGNMGTVIRTAHAAGADCIIMSQGCVDAYNPKTLRATMGSIFHVPVVLGGSALDIVRDLQDEGYKVFASHLNGTGSLYEFDFGGKIAIVIGNEGRGISDEVAQAADQLVKIPMPGGAESLNASVATGLLLYEVVRKKGV
jgi:TrmH family RNA methyltransferase